MNETGWLPIHLTEDAASDRLFSSLPASLDVFHFHNDTFELPPHAVRLARSAACPNQAFRVGESTYGLQFHPEMTPEMVDEWRAVLGVPPWPTPDRAYPWLAATCETLIAGWKNLL